MVKQAMLTLLQHGSKHGWMSLEENKNSRVWFKCNKLKAAIHRSLCLSKATNIQDLTCLYTCGLGAEFSIIVWIVAIKGSFSFIYFKSGGAYSKHQFTAWLDLKDETVIIAPAFLRIDIKVSCKHCTPNRKRSQYGDMLLPSR